MIRSALALAAAATLAAPALADDARNLDTLRAFYATLEDDATGMAEIAAYFSPDFVDHNRSPMAPAGLSDHDAHNGLLLSVVNGFSDEHHDLVLLETLQDGSVLAAWNFTGTHSGDFFGIPATGRQVFMSGFDVYSFDADGKIVAQRHVEDVAGLMAQLTAG